VKSGIYLRRPRPAAPPHLDLPAFWSTLIQENYPCQEKISHSCYLPYYLGYFAIAVEWDLKIEPNCLTTQIKFLDICEGFLYTHRLHSEFQTLVCS
jgi:hypothetical protein